jgi:hypothetical protein
VRITGLEQVRYFPKPGDWTDEVLKLCKAFSESNNIKDVVVASTTGESGAKASELFKGYNLVVVTHSAGFKEPGELELLGEKRKVIEENGGKVLVATHALSGVERSFRKRFGTIGAVELIANALRLFGEGTKVCVEIAIMAADAGLIPVDREVISIAGTGKGYDTALLIKPANSHNFFDLRVLRVLCKPAGF